MKDGRIDSSMKMIHTEQSSVLVILHLPSCRLSDSAYIKEHFFLFPSAAGYTRKQDVKFAMKKVT